MLLNCNKTEPFLRTKIKIYFLPDVAYFYIKIIYDLDANNFGLSNMSQFLGQHLRNLECVLVYLKFFFEHKLKTNYNYLVCF